MVSIPCCFAAESTMPDDPVKALQELRQRIAAEGLPKLSPEALRLFKQADRRGPKLVPQSISKNPLSLSDEARRLFHEKSDPNWPWRQQ
jgi:hypothetical protein